MNEWQPITVGKPEIRDLDTRLQRLEVVFPLSSAPPKEWRDVFAQALQQVQLRGQEVIVMSLEGENELKTWRTRIPDEVAKANDYYLNTVIPDQRAKDDEAREAEEDKRRRIEQARELMQQDDEDE
jgi:hypothetical protein